MTHRDLDVRPLPAPQKCLSMFVRYADLPVGGSFVLVNNDDPESLRAELDADLAGNFGWQYLDQGPAVWRVRISKVSATPLPQPAAADDARGVQTAGEAREVAWDVVAMAPDDEIDVEIRADVDVYFQVLSGSGKLTTEERTIGLAPGNAVWLPRRLRRRQFTAGPDGLQYAMAHRTT